jgi:hypothetical protein
VASGALREKETGPERKRGVRWIPPLFLALLGLIFFFPLVIHPAETLYSPGSDLIAEHIPAKRFLLRCWRDTGELPLWRPDQFGGAPFIHDIQVAVFYPPHWILFLLPPEGVGPTLSWLVAAHVVVAGWSMYAYARRQGLSRAGATAAAIGYMFAGKWMFHLLDAGHYILIGMGWLPLVLLLLESAIRRGCLVRATGAGAAFALIILSTHPQWTFYAALFAAMWTLGTALESAGWLGGDGPRSWRRTLAAAGRWAGLGVWAAVVAGALSAVQLLPTLEAAGQASRGTGVPPDDLQREWAYLIHQLVGPSPVGGFRWEHRAGLGVLWLAAAVLAPALRGGRVRWQAGVWLILWALGLGGGTLLQTVRCPGFAIFQIHARILIVAALPTALLGGVTTDALFGKASDLSRGRRTLLFVLAVAALAAGAVAYGAEWELGVWEPAAGRFPLYGAVLLVLLPVGLGLLAGQLLSVPRLCQPGLARPARLPQQWQAAATAAWLAVLLLDLWAMSWPLVDVRDEKILYSPSACVRAVIDRREAEQTAVRWRVLDTCVNGDAGHSALGEGCPLASVYGLETVGGYSPLDVHRCRDFLQFVSDDPEPMTPFRGSYGQPVLLRVAVRNKKLVDLLGVRYLLQPRDPADQPEGHIAAMEPAWRRVLEDDNARAYNYTLGGVRPLPPYELWENPDVLPRAFVVPKAAPLPDRPDVLDTMKRTDFKKTVLLEDWREDFAVTLADATYRPAEVIDYRPNRVALHEDGPAGWLVLADVDFPGWTCTVNGRPTPIHRADFLFRAVAVPAGPCDVVFAFEPDSYRRGRELSLCAAALVAILFLGAGLRAIALAFRRRVL